MYHGVGEKNYRPGFGDLFDFRWRIIIDGRFPEGATLDDLISANELLVKCGADIKEINAVRKHFSNVKGGQLARSIYPATTISLILSDVIGDPIDIIASGPTCSDNSSFSDALAVIRKYKLMKSMPSTLIKHIKSGVSGLIPETPNQVISHFRMYVISL